MSDTGIESRIEATVSAKKALFRGLFDGTTDSLRYEKSGGFLEHAKALAPAEETPPPAAVAPIAPSAAPALPIDDLTAALARLDVRQTADGGLTINAPPDAARVLARMFAGISAKLSALAGDAGLR